MAKRNKQGARLPKPRTVAGWAALLGAIAAVIGAITGGIALFVGGDSAAPAQVAQTAGSGNVAQQGSGEITQVSGIGNRLKVVRRGLSLEELEPYLDELRLKPDGWVDADVVECIDRLMGGTPLGEDIARQPAERLCRATIPLAKEGLSLEEMLLTEPNLVIGFCVDLFTNLLEHAVASRDPLIFGTGEFDDVDPEVILGIGGRVAHDYCVENYQARDGVIPAL